jgi:hypothetical protein
MCAPCVSCGWGVGQGDSSRRVAVEGVRPDVRPVGQDGVPVRQGVRQGEDCRHLHTLVTGPPSCSPPPPLPTEGLAEPTSSSPPPPRTQAASPPS